MSDDPDPERLKALTERLNQAKGAEDTDNPVAKAHSQGQLAWRMVIELVTGLLIGFGIGYGLDTLFGTTPFLMLIFIGFGFAAGIKTMMRSAREVEDQMKAEQFRNDDEGTPSGERSEHGK